MLTEEKATIDAVKKVSPSVVSIVISKQLPKVKKFILSPFGGPFGFVIPKEDKEEAKEQSVQVGGGSGFVIHSDISSSLILTNKHVVHDPEAEYTVLIDGPEGKEYPASVLSSDPINDIAILKINAPNLAAAKLGNSSKVEIGQTVIAIGTALGMFTNTVSKGIVSGLSRRIAASLGSGEETEVLRGVIQTDVAINQGNSGGPLIDSEAEVIGINTAIIFGAQNIGFAIPINWAKKDIEDILKHGKIMRPYLGLRYVALNKKFQEKYNLAADYGALVIRDHLPGSLAVMPNSPADKAGIKENDVIIELNGKKLDEKKELADLVQEFEVGREIELTILRDGKDKIKTKIKLEEYK